MQKKELSKLVLTTLLTGSVLWGGTAFAAEENLQEFSLDTMVVTATRTAMTVKETPSTVEIVDSKKLEQTQAKTLHDALKGALGVNVFNDFQGRSNVSIRGSESRHVLIMVDGKRLGGEAAYNSANAWDVDRIRMEDVERVEIIRGPAGALYGSDAMGGVINVITKTPDKTTADINYEYGWYEDGKGAGYKGNLYLQGAEGNYSYKINAGLNKNRPYLDPKGSGDSMNFYGKQQPISLSVGYKFDNGNELSVDFSKIKEDNQKSSTSRTVMMPGKVWQDKVQTIYNDNKRTDYAITYKGSDDKQDWMFRAYKSVFDKNYKNQNNTRMTNLLRPGGIGDWKLQDPKHDTVKRTLSVIEGKDTFNLSDKNKLTAGFEYRKDQSEGTRLKKPNTSLADGNAHDAYDKAAINYLAAYVQDEFRPDDKWLIIPSVRFDHSDQFSNKLTSNLAATYNAADDVRIKAVVGQGYKTPTVNDLYIFWEMYAANPGGKGQFYVGNPDLKPEKSLSYELSVEKDWGDRSTVHLGVFRNEVKDLISTYWTGKLTDDDPDLYPGVKGDMIMAYENIPEATLQGVELYGSHRLGKNIYLNAGYTFLDAKDKTNGTRLKDRAKHQVTFGVSYQPENIYAWDLSFDLVSNIGYYFNNGDKSTMGNFVYETKDFTIANIMASRHLNKDTKIYLGIDNISNHQNFGPYSDGNLGRLYRVGMEYKF
ncbi:TonB-dependent receptor plug domain-containing protein [Phascolarctobacterium succinatutens]|jgi:outer membrane receptor for ferrienterochelin and colicins|uniref:TonB-dependent receptor plug domain-containing protein n=2 Tax=Phascolarctobacterium succinatutens TaxID=626940 RepID=UPI0026EE588E|nr:TonB-dependent receptor [Phascolarctobacterium succinatutens]